MFDLVAFCPWAMLFGYLICEFQRTIQSGLWLWNKAVDFIYALCEQFEDDYIYIVVCMLLL